MAVFILVLYHIVNAINTPFNSQRSVSSCSAPLSSWSHLGLLSVVTYMRVSLVVDRSGAHTCRMCETICSVSVKQRMEYRDCSSGICALLKGGRENLFGSPRNPM
jgi:hypothetical protein